MAAPVEPVLASALRRARQEKGLINAGRIEPLLLTACRSVDDAIAPGLVYGESGLCALSCESGTERKQLLNAFLTTHLVETSGNATVIDSQGLDIAALFSTLRARLPLQPRASPNLPPQDADSQAKSLLARVKIMRVFDVDGLLEALLELRTALEHHDPAISPAPLPEGPRSTVPDSQLSTTTSDDEDLLAAATAAPGPQQPPPPPAYSSPPQQHLLILDDLSSLLLPIQRTDLSRAAALFSSLVRALRPLVRAHALACVVANGTVAASKDPGRQQQKQQQQQQQQLRNAPRRAALPPPSSSIFASCAVRPAFGAAVAAVDVHLLVHRVPRRADDARAAYGGAATQTTQATQGEGNGGVAPVEKGRDGKRRREAEWVGCVEVLLDRHGKRKGRFGFFTGDGRGAIRDGL